MRRSIQQPAAPAIRSEPGKGKSTVTIASKLPMHLELRLCRKRTVNTTGRWGNTEEVIFEPTGKVLLVKGNGYPVGTVPKGFPKPPEMIEDAGYALTHGVDRDFWEAWLEQNKDTEMVLNGVIKAHPDDDYLEGDAMEFAKLQSGLHPLDPEGDVRNPKPLNSKIEAVKKDDRVAA